MSTVSVRGKLIVGKFSKVSGSKVREMRLSDGTFLGFIEKLDEGGYRIIRADGKSRVKPLLEEAYRSIARSN